MNQSAAGRLKAAFLGLEISEREAEATKERNREAHEMRRRDFETFLIENVLPALQTVAETIEALGYSASARLNSGVFGPECALEFSILRRPVPAYSTPFTFSVKWNHKREITILHSNPKNVYLESRVKNLPSSEIITKKRVEDSAIEFVENVLAVHASAAKSDKQGLNFGR